MHHHDHHSMTSPPAQGHCHSCSPAVNGTSTTLKRFLLALLCFIPFLVHMVGIPFPFPYWLQWAIASIVQFGPGWTFYRSSLKAIRAGYADMDLLIALGTTAAYLFSFIVLLTNAAAPLYFESSVAIITLVLLGQWLEAKSKGKASAAIQQLLSIQPKTAKVKRNGDFIDLPIEQIVIDDIILVRSGESIAIDGIVVNGEGEINESMVTGESLPSLKKDGDDVLAGTIVTTGSLEIRAAKIGVNTVLAHIIRLVEQAQQSKAPAQRLADAVSAVFVPVVLAISLVTFIGWWAVGATLSIALINAVSVLIIACPCALGLATPIVIIVASGKGALLGIIFKEAVTIEKAQQLTTLCFDKTGTLTIGEPHVEAIIAVNSSEEEVMRIAVSLESRVQHPLAKAILATAKERHILPSTVDDFRYLAGKGIIGVVDGQRCGVGTIAFAKEQPLDIDENLLFSWQQKGASLNGVWQEGRLLGFVATRDQVRSSALPTMQWLKKLGIKTVMLTGDNAVTAQTIAQQAGVDEVHARLLPEEKLAYIKQLKGHGELVGMVGDGINDAPALATADVGIALGASTDIALETASVALMRNNLQAIIDMIKLSKKTVQKVKQNLFFAFIYNIFGIPLAAFGLLNPIVAAAAMAMSSLTVVFNALLLANSKDFNKQS